MHKHLHTKKYVGVKRKSGAYNVYNPTVNNLQEKCSSEARLVVIKEDIKPLLPRLLCYYLHACDLLNKYVISLLIIVWYIELSVFV